MRFSKWRSRLVPSSVGRALFSHYAKYATRITFFIKIKLQLLEFTKRFKCPFIPAKVVQHVCYPMGLRKSAFMAALVGNLTCPNFGWWQYNRRLISPLLACLLFVSRNFSSISFVSLKKGCDTFVSGLRLTILILND